MISAARAPEVYLDSSDFSVMSDPRRQSAEIDAVREELLAFARAGEAIFRLSMAHVCEAAPAQYGAEEAAIRRAALMRQLCGPNTLVSILEIAEGEAKEVAGFDARSTERWVPPFGEVLEVDATSSMTEMVKEEIQLLPNREMRRKAKRGALRGEKMRSTLIHQMHASQADFLGEIMRVFPLSTEAAKAISTYMIGRGNKEDAERALLRVMADPEWLLRHLATKPDEVEKITDWIRGGGANFAREMGAAAANARQIAVNWKNGSDNRLLEYARINDAELRKQLEDGERNLRSKMASTLTFRSEKLERTCILSIVERSGGQLTKDSATPLTELRRRFPGIACTVAAAVHATRRASEHHQSRPMKESDFGDAMHAIYAPYVDLYRTDAFMLEPVSKALRGRPTTVVRSLLALPDAIRAWNAANCQIVGM